MHAHLYSSLTIVQPNITRKLPMMTACSSRSILSIPMTLPLLCTTRPTPPTAARPLHACPKPFSHTLPPMRLLLVDELQRPLLIRAGECG